ncbi:MAG: HAD family phosphatase [Muribaculaceae bacterium]|nr:HAD family phosphatase [Roseburia sp.]MCM1430624.1 HAD family phosphatase [Muribaculaceae bacterium]MCM1491891.1 HAD family phosphatase [Muribaculaceae bacterium]
MFQNIVFDMGNVLLDYDPEVPLAQYCTSDEARDIIRRELFLGPEWKMGDRGEIRDRDRYELVKKRVPEQYHAELKKCAEGWDICMKPLAGAGEFCAYVKEKGYGIYVLSNASDLFYEYFPNFAPIEYFDGVFVSCDVHVIKPDIQIYELFLKKYGLVAAECLFIDDREDNVEGARAAGLAAVRFQGSFDAIREEFGL